VTTPIKSSHAFFENKMSLKNEKLRRKKRSQLVAKNHKIGVTPLFVGEENDNGELENTIYQHKPQSCQMRKIGDAQVE